MNSTSVPLGNSLKYYAPQFLSVVREITILKCYEKLELTYMFDAMFSTLFVVYLFQLTYRSDQYT